MQKHLEGKCGDNKNNKKYKNAYNTVCDGTILAYVVRVCILITFGIPRYLINKGGFLQNGEMLYHKTNRTASTVLCSVIKHLGNDESTQAVRRNVSPCTSFVLSSLPVCFITEGSMVEAVLFVKYIYIHIYLVGLLRNISLLGVTYWGFIFLC